MRAVVRLDRPETTVVTAIGHLLRGRAASRCTFGYSVALGAFLAGSLVAESGEEKAIEQLVQPMRDMFAAIFFVAVGMLIDPRLIAEHWLAVVVFTVVVIVGQDRRRQRRGVPRRLRYPDLGAGRDEPGADRRVLLHHRRASGLASGATGDFLYPVAVAVSAHHDAQHALADPRWRAGRRPGWIASCRGRSRPSPRYTASWMESLRSSPRDVSRRSRERRLAGLLVLDAVLLGALALGVALELDVAVGALTRRTELAPEPARLAVLAGAAALAAPLAIGLLRTAKALGQAIALRALPAPTRGVDLGAAPRRAFLVAWQLVMVAMVGVPLVALTEPFLPRHMGTAVFFGALAVLAIAFWRSATNLQGHTQAGAEIILAALGKQMAGSAGEPDEPVLHRRRASDSESGVAVLAAAPEQARALSGIYDLIPGLGQPVSMAVGPEDYAVGRSLAELDLRDTTDATVLVIVRPDDSVILPVGREVLRAGDVLALAGAEDAVLKARALLRSGPPK